MHFSSKLESLNSLQDRPQRLRESFDYCDRYEIDPHPEHYLLFDSHPVDYRKVYKRPVKSRGYYSDQPETLLKVVREESHLSDPLYDLWGFLVLLLLRYWESLYFPPHFKLLQSKFMRGLRGQHEVLKSNLHFGLWSYPYHPSSPSPFS